MGIIYYSLDNWSNYMKRKHHLAEQFSKMGVEVIYVEAGPPLKERIRFLLQHAFMKYSKIRKINARLSVLSIYATLPYQVRFLPTWLRLFIIKINKRIWGYLSMKYLKELRGTEHVLFINNIYTYPHRLVEDPKQSARGRIGQIVYDCVDILEEFPDIDKRVAQHWEKYAITQADLVFVSAKNLAHRSVMKRAKSITYIPNGVDFQRFHEACTKKDLPDEFTEIKGKKYRYIVGYVGALDTWIDFDLIDLILESDSNATICIIGVCISKHFEDEFRTQLAYFRNKYGKRFLYLGSRAYEQIPSYVSAFDICLVPFKQSKLIQGVNPIKLYEYLACGKPVISTYWDEISSFANVISFIHHHSDIKIALRNELNRLDDPEIKRRRVQVARLYDWAISARRALQAIGIET